MVEEFTREGKKKSGFGKTLAWILAAFGVGFGIMVAIYFMSPTTVITVSAPAKSATPTASASPAPNITNDPTLGDACRAFVVASAKDAQGSGTNYSSLYTEAAAKTGDTKIKEYSSIIISNYILEIVSPEDQLKNTKANEAKNNLANYCIKVGAFTEAEYWSFMNKAAGTIN